MTAAPAAAVETVTLDVVLELELARLRLLLDGRHAPEPDRADERRTAALAALADAGRPAPSERLSALFGLTGFERDVLMLCLAPALDASFPEPTPQLACTLLDGVPDAFLPDARLRLFRLVVVEPNGAPPGRRALRLEDRIHDYLLGSDRLDERVAVLLRPIAPAPVPPSHEPLVERLAAWLRRAGLRPPWPVLNLVGAPRSGKATLARAIAQEAGLELRRLALEGLPQRGPEREELLRLLDREAVIRQFAVYVALPEPGESAAAATDDVLDEIGAPLIVGASSRRRSERPLTST